ncbi:porin family protein [Lacinutrix chionoecetis]
MKKLLFAAAIAVLGFTSANAQEVKFGVKAGVNFATIGGDIEDVDGRTSFHAGGVAEIMVSEKFSVQPEVLYSSQGVSEEYTEEFFGEEVKYEDKLKLDYIYVPVMAKFYVAEGLSLQAGPQVGFLISAEAESEVTVDGETESDSFDAKDSFKGIDFGVGLGAGYKLDNGLNFSARYNLGLSNISDNDDADDFSIQNNVIQVSIGFMF